MVKTRRRKSAKKKTIKKSVTPQDLIPADYNPRSMDDDSKKALKKSMDEFNDISGITWNKVTGNIVTGHHRWNHLCDIYGLDNLVFKHLTGDKHLILAQEGEDTGYILRVVEWDKSKEKAANITANSPKVEGIFTVDLQDVLDDLKLDINSDLFSELRLDELTDSLNSPDDEGSWETDIEAVENVDSNLDGIITTIKVECAQEMRSDVFKILDEAVTDAGLSGKVMVK